MSASFKRAGEPTFVFGGYGLGYSPDGIPVCNTDVFASTHGCPVEALGDGWYYFSYNQNIN